MDTLLWVARRERGDEAEIETAKEILKEHNVDVHQISRAASELICLDWQIKLAKMDPSKDETGRRMVERIESAHKQRLTEFVRTKMPHV